MSLFAVQRKARPIRRAGEYVLHRRGFVAMRGWFPTAKSAKRAAYEFFGAKGRTSQCA